ncbi:hypothetical protein MRB53_002074 [Persea americana]|uniref:Uncharacterized protein n=1 Tax=Persea americana TaxID=3435 RepID=A0ACC2MTP8_PERAE|nr:hypothetical protein MRB53_002074 [Persea americana]
MKKATHRPTKRGSTSATSLSRPPVPSPNESLSSSPPHPSNALKPNTKILKSLLDRPIVVERRVLVDQIKNYNLREVAGRVGWEGLLSWGIDAFPSIDRNMYASVSSTEVTANACSFTISFVDRDGVITPERIGSIIDDPPIAQEPASHPPPPLRASSSRHIPSPHPSTSNSTLDHLGAIETNVSYIKREQKKIKKTINKLFQYLSTISKSCRRDDVAALPSSSPSPPPLDSD